MCARGLDVRDRGIKVGSRSVFFLAREPWKSLGLASDQPKTDSRRLPLPWYFETFPRRSRAENKGTLRPDGALTPCRPGKKQRRLINLMLMMRGFCGQSMEFRLHPTPRLYVEVTKGVRGSSDKVLMREGEGKREGAGSARDKQICDGVQGVHIRREGPWNEHGSGGTAR